MSDLRRLFNDIVRFEIELWNAVDAGLKREFGRPLTHFEPMSVIDRVPGCRVYDIARELGITTGGTSKLVDRIEASGYCRRLPNPADRRSSLLELTPEGQRMLAEAAVPSTTNCSAGSAPRCPSGPCASSAPRSPACARRVTASR